MPAQKSLRFKFGLAFSCRGSDLGDDRIQSRKASYKKTRSFHFKAARSISTEWSCPYFSAYRMPIVSLKPDPLPTK